MPMTERGIALIGMPGAGKSSVGKILADRLDRPFIDIDAQIEQDTGLLVSEIFARFGEAKFRALESETVVRAVAEIAVVSCGGGVVTVPRNVEVLRENCTVIYLAATVDTLVARVGGAQTRPLLCGDARGKLLELAAQRERIYRASCDDCVETDGKTLEEIAEEVLVRIVERQENYKE